MHLFNLGLGEFLGLLGAASGVVLALYLLDRSKQKIRVATLRFWTPAPKPSDLKNRRKIQQPLSLLLQLLSILCLLLAIAQLRWGSAESGARDHVLILDTSAWMGARAGATAREGTLLDAARRSARAWLRTLPSGDRVMVVQADGQATAVTAFETNRQVVEQAIAAASPGQSALRLGQALAFAQKTQRMHARRIGEVVFAGTGRVSTDEEKFADAPKNLRVLPSAGPANNTGVRHLAVRRAGASPDVWEIYVTVKNYGPEPRVVPLAATFGGAPAGTETLRLTGGAEREVSFRYKTLSAGVLDVRLFNPDAFPGDDRASVELPAQPRVKVAVYSNEPNLIRPLLTANPRVEAVFRGHAEMPDAATDAALVILDRPPRRVDPKGPAIWIEPAAGVSAMALKQQAEGVALTRWRDEHPAGRGLRTRDLRLAKTAIFAPASGDVAVAESSAGPVIVARPASRAIYFGFHPMRSELRFELATPLLFANIVQWMAPDSFRRWELNASSAGSITAEVDGEAEEIQVTDENNQPVPFTVQDRTLRFFHGTRGTVRLRDGRRESVYSLTLPEVETAVWTPPATVRRGIPRPGSGGPSATDLWRALAILGAAGLVTEWLLFGRRRLPFAVASMELSVRLRSLLRKPSLLRRAS
ncbi:MAG: VWA domain-containing protein [Acidobacteria bacterium]|nr:VWA domain-containing protein [Acidobacteriota bacterium]